MCLSVHRGSDIRERLCPWTASFIGTAALLLVLLIPFQAAAEDGAKLPEAHFDLPGALIAQSVSPTSETVVSEAAADDQPNRRLMGSEFRRTSSYVHLFGSVTLLHTDNVFNREEDTESDIITIAELGVWGAMPRLNEHVSLTETSTLSPGGLKFSRFPAKYPRHYQAYAVYSATWWQYADHSTENALDHTLGAFLQYNDIRDLSLEIWDLAREGVDPAGIGDTEERDSYQSNFLGTSITFDSGNRTYVRADASFYSLRYDKKTSAFRERDDTQYAGFVFYRVMTRTALFAEADYINVDYKDGFDNRYIKYYLGVQWERRGVSNGSFKVGAGRKNFSDSSEKDAQNLSAELLLSHRFDGKKSVSLSARYTDEESAIETASYSRSHDMTGEYNQKLRGKLSGVINLAYQNNTYFADGEKQRDDTLWRAAVEAQYAFNRWITGAVGYQKLWRNSDADGGDFTTSNYYLKLSGEL